MCVCVCVGRRGRGGGGIVCWQAWGEMILSTSGIVFCRGVCGWWAAMLIEFRTLNHVYIISFVHFDTAMHVIIDQKIRSKANTQRGTGFLCVICSGGLHLRVFKVSKKCDIRFIWGLRSRNYYAKRLSPNLHCKVIHPDGYNICFVGAIMTNFISKPWVLFVNLS